MAVQVTQKLFTTQVRFACDECIRGNTVAVPATVRADNTVRLDYATNAVEGQGWEVTVASVRCPDHAEN